MQKQFLAGATPLAALCLGVVLISPAQTQKSSDNTPQKEAVMDTHASGTFDVKITPQAADEIETAAAVSRMSIDKVIHGELEGTSKGEMLAAMTDVKGSGAYVALERVTGSLNGRTGTFVLQHAGTMTSASQQLLITVVPDSGTGQLVGLAGKFIIKIENKKHFYEFDYSLPADN